jgi:nucleoside-diphosphate-sugar epimerase
LREPRREGEVVATYCDVSKAKHSFGYRPKVTLAAGLPRTWRWFLDEAVTKLIQ